ncbi:MAG: hypothetical protein Q9M28_09010 [Mariprofundaceae bacterium]|nr:hypothetical protein [Mariprofundaceae bacterium]
MSNFLSLFMMSFFMVAMMPQVSEASKGPITTLAHAMNDAGKQRMLTQRMTKLYAMRILRLIRKDRFIKQDIQHFPLAYKSLYL